MAKKHEQAVSAISIYVKCKLNILETVTACALTTTLTPASLLGTPYSWSLPPFQ